MKSRFILSVIVACAFTGSVALAQSMESTPAPKPKKPNFSSFAYMVGTWECSTKSARRPAPYYTTTTWEMDPTGYWLVGKSTQKAMAWFPYESTGEDRITYDADTSRWIDVNTGDYGNYDLQSSKGWTGKKIVWHDLANVPGKDVASSADVTITKVSDTKMTSQTMFKTVKGRSVGVTGTCTKQ